jgi:hypothetical protein
VGDVPQTRRTFIRRAAACGVTLAAASVGGYELFTGGRRAPLSGAGARGAAGERLYRGVALGPGGAGATQSYGTNRRFYSQTRTPWVRLWADWAQLQPDAALPPAMSALDEEIAQAKADGRYVMLTAWRFPRWANGTSSILDDTAYQLQDRVAPGGDPGRRKDLTFKLPPDLGPESPWGLWIDFLLGRYGSSIDALEIVNEPNLQHWPQHGPSPDPASPFDAGPLTIDAAVADMIQTATTLAARHDNPPLIVAPATSDVSGESRTVTGYDTFTRALLDRLAERDFDPGPQVAWSHHNYTDVEGDLGGGDNRLAQVRRLLERRWTGWPHGDAARPGVLVTESGARVTKVAKTFGLPDAGSARRKQADLLERSWRRLASGPEGAGVGLLCLYLFRTDPNYDSGLCEANGTPRPAYYAWADMPTLT